MTHVEFNELMGFTTTTEVFDFANFLYIKAGEMNKQDFVKEFKKIGKSILIKEWKEEMYRMDLKQNDSELLINRLQDSYISDMLHILCIIEDNPQCFSLDMYNFIISKVGHKQVITYKISRALPLNNIDLDYIAKHIK